MSCDIIRQRGCDGFSVEDQIRERRVRVDPPTLEEALYAAEGLTPDSSEQLQIAAELMHLPVDAVWTEAQIVTRRRACTAPSMPHRQSGSVIVESKHPRRFASRR